MAEKPAATVTITLTGACETDTATIDLTDAAQPELCKSSATFGTTEDIHPVAASALSAVKSSILSKWVHGGDDAPYRSTGAGSARIVVDLRGTPEVPDFARAQVFQIDVETSDSLSEALTKAMLALVDAAAEWLRNRKDATKPRRPRLAPDPRPRIADELPS